MTRVRGATYVRVSVVVAVVAASALLATPVAADQVRSDEYWLDSYGIRAAWEISRGAGVTIAIIDTGVDGTAAELRGAVVGGADFSGQGSPDGQTPVGEESSDHGTSVAGLAAGRGTGADNGVIGTAPEASLLSASIGLASGDSDQQIADAVRWAVDHGADVINMSFTRNTIDWPESWDEAFLYAMDHDVVIVAAAGNRDSGLDQVGAPATIPGVLTVAGVDAAGNVSKEASSQGITIAVAAPSENLVGLLPGGQVGRWSGTSGAAPIVAGIVALVMAAHPELDADNVINRITSTARDVGQPGYDSLYGNGLVDARAAVTAVVPTVSRNPMDELSEWITLNRRADATPAPPPGGASYSVPESVALAPNSPFGHLLPTVHQLRVAGIPLAVFAAFVATVAALTGLAVRRYFRSRRKAE